MRPATHSQGRSLRDQLPAAGSTPLHAAAQAGDTARVAEYLARGLAIEAEDGDGRTPLYLAAKFGRLEAATLLLGKGAAVNHADSRLGFTPLHVAAEQHQLAVMALLLARGADVNARNFRGQTPLWQASWQTWHPDTEVLALLIDHGADISAADRDGFMPLHTATVNGNLAAVRLLLDRGADVDSTCRRRTALGIAQAHHQAGVVQLLRARGAKAIGEDQPEELSAEQAQHHKPASQPRRVFDEGRVLRLADVGRFEDYLYWIYTESDVDVRFVFTQDLGGMSLEDYAAKRMTELGIGGRSRKERGILLVYDLIGKKLRIEVGYGLEEYFPDAFVDYLIREHAQTFFETGDPAEGLMLLMRIIQDRFRQAVFGQTFDPHALDEARSYTLLSGGAGASRHVALGQDPDRYFRSKLDPARRRHFGAQPTPEETRARYVEWLAAGQFDPDVEILTPRSRQVLAAFPLTRAYFEWIAQGEVGKKATKVLVRNGLALLCFTEDPLASPDFFRKAESGWQMDIAANIATIKNIDGGVYTWNWIGTNDEFSTTFADRLVRVRGFTRVVDSDNRMLPIRGAGE